MVNSRRRCIEENSQFPVHLKFPEKLGLPYPDIDKNHCVIAYQVIFFMRITPQVTLCMEPEQFRQDHDRIRLAAFPPFNVLIREQ